MKSKLKKIIKISVSTLLGAVVLGGVIASSVINSSTNNTNLFAEIVVSDNVSILSDKSFSETTFNGYSKFLKSKGVDVGEASRHREGFGIWRRPGNTNLEREVNFKGIFENGKNLVIAPGFNHASGINSVLKDQRYKDKGFLLLDSNIDTTLSPGNAVTITFRMEQAGFQSGIAASEFLYTNHEIFIKDDNLLKIGGFVGLPFPTTMDFLIGFQKGMVAWNESPANKSRLAAEGLKPIEWIPLGKDESSYASMSFGIGGGRDKAAFLLSQNADIIMPIAGPQTLDVIQEIQRGNRPVAIVGVDSAQEDNPSLQVQQMPNLNGQKIKSADGITDSPNQGIIQFSALKKLDIAVNEILTSIFSTDDSLLPYRGFGYHNIAALGELGEGAVGISENGKNYFSKGFGQTLGDNPANAIAYENAIKSLPSNVYFNELITKADYVKFYDNKTGLPLPQDLSSFKGLTPYLSGITNTNERFYGSTRLDGSEWEVEKK